MKLTEHVCVNRENNNEPDYLNIPILQYSVQNQMEGSDVGDKTCPVIGCGVHLPTTSLFGC